LKKRLAHNCLAIIFFINICFVDLLLLGDEATKSSASTVSAVVAPVAEKWAVPESGKINIGADFDLSRQGAEISRKLIEGFELAFYEANKSGGINGRPLELRAKDDESNPAKARENISDIRKFYKTDLIIGPFSWAVMAKLMDLVNNGEILSLFPWVSNTDVRRPRAKNIINYQLGAYQEFSAVARTLIEKVHPKKVAIAYFSDIPAQYIDMLCKLNGIKNYISIVHEATNADFSKQIGLIDKEKPEALVLMTPPASSMSLMRALGDRINNMTVAANSGSVGAFFDDFVRSKAKSYIVGRGAPNLAMQGRTIDMPDKNAPGGKRTITLTIIDEYKALIADKKAEGIELELPNDETRFMGYISGRLLVMMLRKVQGVITKEKIMAVAETMQDISLGGLPLSYDLLRHQFSNYVWIDDGSDKWVPYYVGDVPFPPGFLTPEEIVIKNEIEAGSKKQKESMPQAVPVAVPAPTTPATTAQLPVTPSVPAIPQVVPVAVPVQSSVIPSAPAMPQAVPVVVPASTTSATTAQLPVAPSVPAIPQAVPVAIPAQSPAIPSAPVIPVPTVQHAVVPAVTVMPQVAPTVPAIEVSAKARSVSVARKSRDRRVIPRIFENLTEVERYAAKLDEFPEPDNTDLENPDFDTYLKTMVPNWISRQLEGKVGLRSAGWSASGFKELLEIVLIRRENQGCNGRFVQTMKPKPGDEFLIIGELHGAFHSSLRDIRDWVSKQWMTEDFKIIMPNYFVVINGGVVSRSPYTLETLTLLLRLMYMNPDRVIYIRGVHEDKEHWEHYGLKKELKVRAAHISSEKIPLQKLVNRFFVSLPLALYLLGEEKEKVLPVVRISGYGRDTKELDEKNFAGLLAHSSCTFCQINNKKHSDVMIDVRALIRGEQFLKQVKINQGLIPSDKEEGAMSWILLSCPTGIYRSLFGFNYDTYVLMSIYESFYDWTLALYSQDVRDLDGFKRVKVVKLISGTEVADEKVKEGRVKELQQQLQETVKQIEVIKKDLSEIEKSAQPVQPATTGIVTSSAPPLPANVPAPVAVPAETVVQPAKQ
jgi:hypothetical protein